MLKSTDQFRGLLNRAASFAETEGRDYVTPKDIVAAILVRHMSPPKLALLKETGPDGGVPPEFTAHLASIACQPEDLVGRIVGGEVELSPELEAAIEQELRALDHKYAGTEHLPLGLCAIPNPQFHAVLQGLGNDRTTFRRTILEILGHDDEA